MRAAARLMVEHTPDGRYIVVDGRRWRATDPSIPDKLRAQLVDELMTARRGVRDGASDARDRVQDAKLALGERGEPWWDKASADGFAHRATATVRALLRHRDPDSTICPSDVARVVGGSSWRATLDDVRTIVADMQRDGTVQVTQHGRIVEVGRVKGPVRIGRGPKW